MKFISEYFRIFFYLLLASRMSVVFYLGVATIIVAIVSKKLNFPPFYLVVMVLAAIIAINPGRRIRKSRGEKD